MSHYGWNRRFYDHIDDPYDSIYMGEPALQRRRRLRAEEKEGKEARVIDRTGSDKSLERAAKRLKHVRAEDRVLYVPQWDMAKAENAMRKAGVNGAVSNLCGSQVKRVQGGKR
ncbi:MAG: hypothetical protein HY054_05620 [Proteobacteria bacterium]|nr:hypothetical protein [Pseudomonadota bacterium]